jgi:hypothetical protein
MLSTCIPHFLRAAVFAAFLFVAACQTAPVQEMSDARQAISVAREAGAEQYAAELLQAAVGYLQSAEGFLNERRYDLARRDAVSAKSSALDALRRSEASSESEVR